MTVAGTETQDLVQRAPETLPAAIRVLRPHQWVKNVLVFIPLLLAHRVPWGDDAARWWQAVAAFAAFCLTASAIYVINDRLDVASDRLHPRKRRRPFASGELALSSAVPIALTLLVLAGAIAAFLPLQFAGVLLLYAAVSVLYSFWLKRKMLVDVFVLAGLYTLRLMAGDRATGVPLSQWLLAFSTFFFISLAFAKRYAELRLLEKLGQTAASGRDYSTDDLRIIEAVGPASGYLAVLVLALYLNDASSAATSLYRAPFFLWLLCPLLMYWITRVWFLARRGRLDDDPILFAIRDRVSWLTMTVATVLTIAAWQPWQS